MWSYSEQLTSDNLGTIEIEDASLLILNMKPRKEVGMFIPPLSSMKIEFSLKIRGKRVISSKIERKLFDPSVVQKKINKKGVKAWLVLPEERPTVERDYVVEGLCDRKSVMREIASGENENSKSETAREWERPSTSAPPPPDDIGRKRYKLLRMGERIHRINYSISLWFYIAPLTENYHHEMNILNFSNKVVVSLGTDGTVIYVDVDSRLNEGQLRHDKNPNMAKNKVKGRVAKRIFALDTFAHQRWNHLALTTDHEGRMNAFINGILVATNDDVRPDLGPNNHMIYLGEKGGAKGMVKAVYYYNKVLTKTDVELLYKKMHVVV